MTVTIIVEQPQNSKYRMKYIPEENRFIETKAISLGFARGIRGVYGWLDGYGRPPQPHLDAYLYTDRDYAPGQAAGAKVIGCFIRADGDSKLVCLEPERPENELLELPPEEAESIKRLYPRVGEGEGWFGRERAMRIIQGFGKL